MTPSLSLSLIDRAIAAISPSWALRRVSARAYLERAQFARAQQAAYEAAGFGTSVWHTLRGAQASNDALLASALPLLRDRARHAFRNNPVVRSCVRALEALMVGTGIDIEPDTGDENADRAIKAQWDLFVYDLDAGGCLSLWDLERQDIRMEAQCGISLWYLIYRPELVDEGKLPVQIMPLHPAQLAQLPVEPVPKDCEFRNGVVRDRYGRAIAYDITSNPGDSLIITNGQAAGEPVGMGLTVLPMRKRIPAEFILCSYEPLEPGQAVGEPAIAPALSRTHDAGELVAAELTSAKIGAAPAIAITSPTVDAQNYGGNAKDDNGNTWNTLEAGSIARLFPGEDVKTIENKRPSQNVMTFLRSLHGHIAGALRIPARAIDRDPSQASFSALGADAIDQERSLEPEAERYGRQKPGALYQRVFPLLCAAARVTIPKDPQKARRFRRYRLVLEKRPYVNRLDDVRASILAIQSGLSTYERELGRLGENARELLRQWLVEQDSEPVKRINARLGSQLGSVGTGAKGAQGLPTGDPQGVPVGAATADADADSDEPKSPAEDA